MNIKKEAQIDVNDLMKSGYKEENDWDGILLYKPVRIPLGISLLTCFIMMGVIFFTNQSIDKVRIYAIIFLSSLGICFLCVLIMRLMKPKSPISGKLLKQYYNKSPKGEDTIIEIVYVDHENKRYFTHVYLENGENGS